MKANELQIGDWLMSNDGMPRRVIELSGIIEDYIELEDGTESGFNPIPLTPEILVKNAYPDNGGWYCFGDFYVAHYGDCYVIHQNPDDDKREFLCRIYNVHELQHALRLCGLNELADNFKIE